MPLNGLAPGRVDGYVANARGNAVTGTSLHTFPMPEKAGEPEPEMLTIRLADCDGQKNRANMLLDRMYSWRGYGSGHQVPSAPNCVTFTASSDEEVIGTLTLRVDSPAGLAADATFKQELEPFRNIPGASLCELTKFAFDVSGPSKPRLAALFHIIFIYGSKHYNCTDLFIEVNPRHRRFYQTMLGFECVGPLKPNAAVGAPAQLMWLNVAEIRRYINKHAGDESQAARSLYPHFFSPEEERGIYARLAGSTDRDGDTAYHEADRVGHANHPFPGHNGGAAAWQAHPGL
ncbi:MAG: hypothetical protein AVDCRST_MAG91-1831 [uncultured Sphingomonadaceae bacterium]|uniref:N-acyl amino acid synthase FeeM catalytic core domain-containing protein n=1 Tax=uncultured Sphingomonadaceae bacterium TaxID=169976 RepID=A0A6J4T649_9SPHN|nr:MAG: hypothetical protein AVDCRST_MAG91-1831 [uncultured Sphingomonadaceae bacterium]